MLKRGRPLGTKKNGLKYLNNSQLKPFHSALQRKGSLRDQVMMELTLYLGLRASELVNIRLTDIEPDSRQITIKGLKSGRTRSYPDLESALWSKLSKYLKKSKTIDDDRIFPLTPQTAKNVFKRYARLAGLSSDYSIHSLRHTIAIMRARAGDSPIAIMLWLRHRSVGSTQRYFEQVQFENDSLRMNELFTQYK